MNVSPTKLHPALFLDRDGVLNHNRVDYVKSLEELAIYPQALEALVLLAPLPLKIIVITNQSVVGRGLISLEQAQAINRHLKRIVEKAGGRIDQIYLCPHAPGDECACRKPLPGMIVEAAHDHAIDLAHSTLIGDALTDIAAGRAAGIETLVLVRSGRGTAQLTLPEASDMRPFQVFDDLEAAVRTVYDV